MNTNLVSDILSLSALTKMEMIPIFEIAFDQFNILYTMSDQHFFDIRSQWSLWAGRSCKNKKKTTGHAVAQLVETLRYKSEGRGFDSRWYHWNFS